MSPAISEVRRPVRANIVGTALFTVTAAYAAISFTTFAQWVGAVTALTLFAAGVFGFLWSYFHAVQRSRHDEISVTGLYLLLGEPTPRSVKLTMWPALAAQVAIALATTLGRPDGPDGRAGSSLAVGFLVPMFGLGMNGLWSAYHGAFPLRRRGGDGEVDNEVEDATAPEAVGEVTTPGSSIGQNADHG